MIIQSGTFNISLWEEDHLVLSLYRQKFREESTRLVLLQMLLYQMQRTDGVTNCYKETDTFFKHVLFVYIDLACSTNFNFLTSSRWWFQTVCARPDYFWRWRVSIRIAYFRHTPSSWLPGPSLGHFGNLKVCLSSGVKEGSVSKVLVPLEELMQKFRRQTESETRDSITGSKVISSFMTSSWSRHYPFVL